MRPPHGRRCSLHRFPEPVADAVRDAYARLVSGAEGPVAVRSSATAEDLPGASFAGQQDTYLNVAGVDDVLDAVHRCWASLWTDRAVAYRAAQGIDGSGVALAVVVQRMVDAESAGVLFTADPVTGRRRQAVLDAARGLGDAVVSGAVDPDHFVVDAATGRILDRRLGSTADDGAACLTDAQVRALVSLGDRVESAFGSPQDIEWAVDADGHVWLTQARPITTLYPIPVRACRRPPTRPASTSASASRRACTGRSRRWASPPSGWSARDSSTSSGADPSGSSTGRAVSPSAASRIFLDATPIVRSAVGREIMPRALDVMEARSAVVLRGLFDDPRFSVRPGSRRRFVGPALRLAARIRLPFVVAQALVSPAAAQRRVRRLADEVRAGDVPAGGDISTRVDAVVDLLFGAMPLAPRSLPGAVAGFAMLGLAGRLLRGTAQPGDLQTVLRSAPDNVTTEMDLELWRVAVRATGRRRLGGRVGHPDRAGPRRQLPRRHPARRTAARHDGVPEPVRPPRRRRDRSGHAAVVGRPRALVRRAVRVPAPGPGRGHARTAFRGGRARRQGHGGHADPTRPPAQPLFVPLPSGSACGVLGR